MGASLTPRLQLIIVLAYCCHIKVFLVAHTTHDLLENSYKFWNGLTREQHGQQLSHLCAQERLIHVGCTDPPAMGQHSRSDAIELDDLNNLGCPLN